MTVRHNIYYWKCDSPQSIEKKRQLYFQDKYLTEVEYAVRRACRDYCGEEPEAVKPVGCDGNHFAYVVDYPGKKYFFRADDGSGGDDYMLAESRLMQLALAAGLPVPDVYSTEIDSSLYGFRFQIMDCIPEPCLNVYHKSNRLNIPAVARQLGALLRRLHGVEIDGFGFIDTDRLRREGVVKGLDSSYDLYFAKRLEDHLAYLRDHELLTALDVARIWRLIDAHRALLARGHGVLVHRDPALWNVLGTPERITAVIDWDDAVSGDPADDLGMLLCFYDDAFMTELMAGYWNDEPVPADFNRRVWLHCLRNMLWKTMIRDYMGYFQKDKNFFLTPANVSLREYTLNKLERAMNELEGDCR